MNKRNARVTVGAHMVLVAAAALLIGSLRAPSAAAQDGGEKKSTKSTLRVDAAPFKVVVSVSGVLESTQTGEVKADTKSWTGLTIDRILPEGSTVKAGDPIVWFETDKYERKLRDSRYALKLGQLGLQTAELDMSQLKETMSLDRALAERSRQRTREDFNYFVRTDRPQQEESARFSVKTSEGYLENAQEELHQLEQMYKEDELTEESEEIVLKRAKRSVESAEFSLRSAKLRSSKTLETTLPRRFEELKDTLTRKELEYQKTMATLALSMERKQIEMEKARFALEKDETSHKELESDRSKLMLTAPIDGVVYYGRAVRGKWSGGTGSSSRKLEKGTAITGSQVVATIVDPDRLRVRVDVSEKDLHLVAPDDAGVVVPTAFPNDKLRGRVASVSHIPMTAGKFDAVVEIDGDAGRLMPGMTCTVKIMAYENATAIAVPSKVIFSDDDVNSYVYVGTDNGPQRRTVKVGHTSGGRTEIVEGLKAGETILLEKP